MTSHAHQVPGSDDDHAVHHRPHGTSQSPDFSAHWWEDHYRGGGGGGGGRPSAPLVAEVADMTPGTALDAGCGTGADALWLAEGGWRVTAVDVSPTAVQQVRTLIEGQQASIADRIVVAVADLAHWQPPRRYDLVISQYVHPDMPFDHFVARLADAVTPGGTLLIVGHHADDAHSTSHAPVDASIGIDTVVGALRPDRWNVVVAENRIRTVTRGATELTMADVVVKAERAGPGPDDPMGKAVAPGSGVQNRGFR